MRYRFDQFEVDTDRYELRRQGVAQRLGFVFDRCCEVAAPEPGDVMVLRYGRCYSHGGVVTNAVPLTIVHAYHPAGRVLEESVAHDSVLSHPARKPRFFSLWA